MTVQPTYAEALALVTADEGKPSPAWLQRKMQIGYDTAAGFISEMEANGVVSAPDRAGHRRVIGRDPEMTITMTTAGGQPVTGTLAELKAATAILAGRKAAAASAPAEKHDGDTVLNSNAQTQLRTIVERIERLEEDKAGVMADLKEVYAEAKGNGFDTKILRKVVRMRKQDKAKLSEEEALIDLYLSAIGGL
jgi:uncharacterized protein (UPF0335 family)